MTVTPDYFDEHELLIMDVALNEFIWSLEDELDSWDHVNNDGFGRDENEYDTILEMLTEAEMLSEALQDILVEEDQYV